jgi:hypothetical protein
MTEKPPREIRDLVIYQLTDIGLPASEIATKLGISPRTVARVRTRDKGYVNPEPMSACEIERAKAMLEEGVCYTEVARTIGRSPKVVMKRVPGYRRWTKSEASEYAAFVRKLNRLW